MYALSIRQPWAWAILHAGKDIENRDYITTRFRGRIAIHASAGMTKDEYEIGSDLICEIKDSLDEAITVPLFNSLVRGAIVGFVDIVDCVSESNSPWFLVGMGSF